MRNLRRGLEQALALAIVFGAGFAATRWLTGTGTQAATSRPAEPPPRADALARTLAPATRPAPDMDRGAPADHGPVVADDRAALRRSELADWMRFRYEQPNLSAVVEMLVIGSMQRAVDVRGLAQECAARLHLPAASALELSAAVEIRGRDVHAHGWGCDGDPEREATRICGCVATHLPDDVQVAVPRSIADDALAPYDGMLIVRLHPDAPPLPAADGPAPPPATR